MLLSSLTFLHEHNHRHDDDGCQEQESSCYHHWDHNVKRNGRRWQCGGGGWCLFGVSCWLHGRRQCSSCVCVCVCGGEVSVWPCINCYYYFNKNVNLSSALDTSSKQERESSYRMPSVETA